MSLQSSLGLQATNKTGEIALIAMFVCTALVVADLFNIFDGVGLVKKTGHKLVPGIFGVDKFRTQDLKSTQIK